MTYLCQFPFAVSSQKLEKVKEIHKKYHMSFN